MSMSPANLPLEIDVVAVKNLLDSQEEFLLLDCREPKEHRIASIPAAQLIPMREIPIRVAELEAYRDRRVVVHCHHGGRSLRVAEWLRQQGFSGAQNMTGGIDAWSLQVDPQLPRY
jgi:rhodanese-related sulfurtransferase